MADFDWSNSTDELVFQSSASVAVYLNIDGDLVIRQQRDEYEDEDSVVIIPRTNVAVLIRKIYERRSAEPGHCAAGQGLTGNCPNRRAARRGVPALPPKAVGRPGQDVPTPDPKNGRGAAGRGRETTRPTARLSVP